MCLCDVAFWCLVLTCLRSLCWLYFAGIDVLLSTNLTSPVLLSIGLLAYWLGWWGEDIKRIFLNDIILMYTVSTNI